jgi:hypothetical protein
LPSPPLPTGAVPLVAKAATVSPIKKSSTPSSNKKKSTPKSKKNHLTLRPEFLQNHHRLMIIQCLTKVLSWKHPSHVMAFRLVKSVVEQQHNMNNRMHLALFLEFFAKPPTKYQSVDAIVEDYYKWRKANGLHMLNTIKVPSLPYLKQALTKMHQKGFVEIDGDAPEDGALTDRGSSERNPVSNNESGSGSGSGGGGAGADDIVQHRHGGDNTSDVTRLIRDCAMMDCDDSELDLTTGNEGESGGGSGGCGGARGDDILQHRQGGDNTSDVNRLIRDCAMTDRDDSELDLTTGNEDGSSGGGGTDQHL